MDLQRHGVAFAAALAGAGGHRHRGATVQAKLCVAMALPLTAVTTTGYGVAQPVPAARVPLIRPVLRLRLRPAGSPVEE